jgi:hypothetical protein
MVIKDANKPIMKEQLVVFFNHFPHTVPIGDVLKNPGSLKANLMS